MLDDASFREIALANPANRRLLDGLAELGLPQCHLTAGCLFQTLWNVLSGRPPNLDPGLRRGDGRGRGRRLHTCSS